MKEKKEYPLILVFYLDAEMMNNPQIIGPFSEAVNQMLIAKDANVLAFFLPTEGEERIECLNPVVIPQDDMVRINKIIEDIQKNFSIGDGSDMDIQETTKPCECTNNPGGSCQC